MSLHPWNVSGFFFLKSPFRWKKSRDTWYRYNRWYREVTISKLYSYMSKSWWFHMKCWIYTKNMTPRVCVGCICKALTHTHTHTHTAASFLWSCSDVCGWYHKWMCFTSVCGQMTQVWTQERVCMLVQLYCMRLTLLLFFSTRAGESVMVWCTASTGSILQNDCRAAWPGFIDM